MNNIEKKLEYHELLMTFDNLSDIKDFKIPNGFHFEFFKDEKDIKAWVNIHLSTGEFNNLEKAYEYFHIFFDKFYNELNNRCLFIVDNSTNKKIATATVSACDEYGYKSAIDWFAVHKDYQCKHLSKPLLSKIVKTAKALNYNQIILHTQTHTWLAAKIYLDFGFEPYLMKNDIKGWQILKKITNHEKLKSVMVDDTLSVFDELSINVVDQLNKIHKDYTYSIWYKDKQNDVYVHEHNCDKFYHYKFYKNGKQVKLLHH